MSSMRRASRPISIGQHVIGQVAGHGQLAPVERGVAEAVDAVLGLELQRDEVASRATRDDLAAGDSHEGSSCSPDGLRPAACGQIGWTGARAAHRERHVRRRSRRRARQAQTRVTCRRPRLTAEAEGCSPCRFMISSRGQLYASATRVATVRRACLPAARDRTRSRRARPDVSKCAEGARRRPCWRFASQNSRRFLGPSSTLGVRFSRSADVLPSAPRLPSNRRRPTSQSASFRGRWRTGRPGRARGGRRRAFDCSTGQQILPNAASGRHCRVVL